MRLWSVVVTQPATRPRVHGTGATGASALAATGDLLLQVVRQRLHLLVAPSLAHGGHRALPIADDSLDGIGIADDRAAFERRPDLADVLRSVALGADAGPDLLAEVRVAGRLGLL